jgi:hypothetical protein
MDVARTVWGYIERRDHRLMRRMNRWRAPRWVRLWMILATRMGDGWLWYGLGIMLLIDGGPQRFSAIGAAGTAAVFGIFVFKALKRLSQRQSALPIGAALLVESSAARSVLVSLGAHDDGFLHRFGGELLLSFA